MVVAQSQAPTTAIRLAHDRIDRQFRDTPQLTSESLSDVLGVELILKVECVNVLRSFKGRGCDNYMAAADPSPRILVGASAGNFGQALAFAARRHGSRVIIFAALAANRLKVDRMRGFGADVRLVGRDFDEAKDAARAFALKEGLPFVEDGAEPLIAEGAGTIGLELTRDLDQPVDDVFVPLGNGALAVGIGTWLRSEAPGTKLTAVCASRAPAMLLSWREGAPVPTERSDTIADGIAVRVPVPEAVTALDGVVHDVVAVDDELIVESMQLLHSQLGLVVEPAGAAGLAGVLALLPALQGRRVAVPICGGNLTDGQVRKWLCR